MMKCNEVNEMIALYIDNELSEPERIAFEEHIASCEACRREVEEISQLVRACGEIEEEELPEGFAEDLHKKLLAAGAKESKEKKILQFPAWKIRTFSTVAAGFVIVIIAAFLFKDSIFSPPKMGKSMMDMAAETKQDANAKLADSANNQKAEAAQNSGGNADESKVAAADGGNEIIMQFSESAETNTTADEKSAKEAVAADAMKSRSSTGTTGTTEGTTENSNFKGLPKLAMTAAAPEKRTASLTIYALDTKAAGENLEKLVTANGGEKLIIESRMMSIAPPENSTQPTDTVQAAAAAPTTGSSIVLNYKIPNDKYDIFKEAVQKTFGQIGIEAAPPENQGLGETLDTLQKQSNELADRISKAESKEVEISKDELASLKEEKTGVDSEIKAVSAEMNFTFVTITIMKK